MSFWLAYIVTCMALGVLLELFLILLWFKKSKCIRKNLQRMILTGEVVCKVEGGTLIFIRSGLDDVIIDKTWFTMNGYTGGSYGGLQIIMARKLHSRARKYLEIRETLE